MDRRLAESYVNRRDHRVLGVQLHPYCFYDIFFLTLDENPILFRDRTVTVADLQMAVLICSTEPEVLLEGRRGVGRVTRWWRGVKSRVMNPELELLKFVTYVNDYDARPVFWEGGDGTRMKAPWIVSIAAFIESHSNMTEREIMTAPAGKMFWKSAALAEQLGTSASDIMSEEEEEAMKELGINLNA